MATVTYAKTNKYFLKSYENNSISNNTMKNINKQNKK